MIIVSGHMRTGTSLTAGTLKLLGVYMGFSENPLLHEDMEFDYCKFHQHLQHVAIRREEEHGALWGFKNPMLHLWFQEMYPYLTSPKVIICTRAGVEPYKEAVVSQWLGILEAKGLEPLLLDFSLPQATRIVALSKFIGLEPTQQQLDSATEFYNPERGYHAICKN